jgi:hypothetical protein
LIDARQAAPDFAVLAERARGLRADAASLVACAQQVRCQSASQRSHFARVRAALRDRRWTTRTSGPSGSDAGPDPAAGRDAAGDELARLARDLDRAALTRLADDLAQLEIGAAWLGAEIRAACVAEQDTVCAAPPAAPVPVPPDGGAPRWQYPLSA